MEEIARERESVQFSQSVSQSLLASQRVRLTGLVDAIPVVELGSVMSIPHSLSQLILPTVFPHCDRYHF